MDLRRAMTAVLGGFVLTAAVPVIAAPPTDACAVLSSAQVSAAVGQTVGNGTGMGPGMMHTCTWTAQGMIVTLLVQQDTKMFDGGKGALAASQRSPASGVGEDAYYLGMGTSGTALWVKKDGGSFKMSVYTKKLSLDQVKQAEMTLAKQVAAKF